MDDPHLDLIARHNQRIEQERAAEYANLHSAQLNYDGEGEMRAADRILELDGKQAALATRYQNYIASMSPRQAAPGNGVDLTPNEAMQVSGLNPNKQEDVALYNSGARRLAALKGSGHYQE